MSRVIEPSSDDAWMTVALEMAERAAHLGEVPVGAVLISAQGKVIATAHNEREASGVATHHAEILAIEAACRKLGQWRLLNTTLYVTLEPCPMCAGAIINSRISRLVYGASDPKAGAVHSLYSLLSDPRLNHRPQVTGGVLASECASALTSFFRARRE